MNKFFSAALATTLLVGTLTTAIGSNSLAAPRVASSNNNSGDRSHTVNLLPTEDSSGLGIDIMDYDLANVTGGSQVKIMVKTADAISGDVIKEAAAVDSVTVLATADITVYVDGNLTAVTPGDIYFTMNTTPTAEQLDNFDVVVVRDHNGQIDILPCVVSDGKIIFTSNMFSRYSLCLLPKGSYYKSNGGNNGGNDSAPTPQSTPESSDALDSVPKTGNVFPTVIVGILVVSLLGYLFTFVKKR